MFMMKSTKGVRNISLYFFFKGYKNYTFVSASLSLFTYFAKSPFIILANEHISIPDIYLLLYHLFNKHIHSLFHVPTEAEIDLFNTKTFNFMNFLNINFLFHTHPT